MNNNEIGNAMNIAVGVVAVAILLPVAVLLNAGSIILFLIKEGK